MKMFKKLMAVALVAVMALTMFTACGAADTKDVLDELNKKLGTSYEVNKDTSLQSDAKKVEDAVKDNISKESEIDKAIDDLTLGKGEKAFYVLTNDAEKAAKEIKTKLTADKNVTYSTIYIISGRKGLTYYVCGVAKSST